MIVVSAINGEIIDQSLTYIESQGGVAGRFDAHLLNYCSATSCGAHGINRPPRRALDTASCRVFVPSFAAALRK